MPLGSLGSCSSLGVAIRLRAHAVGPHPSSGRTRFDMSTRTPSGLAPTAPVGLPLSATHAVVFGRFTLFALPYRTPWGHSACRVPLFGRAETTVYPLRHAPPTVYRANYAKGYLACGIVLHAACIGVEPLSGPFLGASCMSCSSCGLIAGAVLVGALLPTAERAAESVSALKMTRGTQRDALRTLACQRGRNCCACALRVCEHAYI